AMMTRLWPVVRLPAGMDAAVVAIGSLLERVLGGELQACQVAVATVLEFALAVHQLGADVELGIRRVEDVRAPAVHALRHARAGERDIVVVLAARVDDVGAQLRRERMPPADVAGDATERIEPAV